MTVLFIFFQCFFFANFLLRLFANRLAPMDSLFMFVSKYAFKNTFKKWAVLEVSSIFHVRG